MWEGRPETWPMVTYLKSPRTNQQLTDAKLDGTTDGKPTSTSETTAAYGIKPSKT